MSNPSGSASFESSSSNCIICDLPVNQDNADTWKQVIGMVGGPRKDSMRLRKDTGYFAHDECVARLQAGVADDQGDLFEEVVSNDIHFTDNLPTI